MSTRVCSKKKKKENIWYQQFSQHLKKKVYIMLLNLSSYAVVEENQEKSQ